MKPAELTQSLQQEAARLGFAFSGACAAVSPTGFPQFLDWVDAGYAGEMQYLDERRDAYQHPRSVLPNVKSILMLAMNYRSETRTEDQSGTGKIARYAWGQGDYHDLIHARLKSLKKFAQSLNADMNVRGVVDTAPLLERDYARLAGLGWIGKNTLLLNKHNGSFFFLAALLLDQELVYDESHESSHCGTCTACLDACPTDAFVQPYVLDATKCISYLTIEHRSPVPVELRDQMDGWLLGCDVCQDVCPWNRKAPMTSEPVFHADDGNNPLELRPLFDLDEDSYRKRFRKTPLWRPKRRGILRNAAYALGNHPAEANVAPLLKGLQDDEALVRAACAWALSCHQFESVSQQIKNAIEETLETDEDADVKEECRRCLAKIGSK